MASHGAGSWPGSFMVSAARAYSVSLMSVDLPEPDTPVTQVMRPSGSFTVMFLRLLPRAPRMMSQSWSSAGRRRPGSAICRRPERYWPVSEARVDMISCGVPWATISPPWAPAPGPRSTTWSAARIASSSCSTMSTRVAEVAQARERAEQPLVVALVQADRGLVEDVHDADEARADLAGEADALRLAAREGLGAAIETEVVEADI